MSNKLAERPQAPKEFNDGIHDHGTRGNVFANDGDRALELHDKWRTEAAFGTADITDGIAEYYGEETDVPAAETAAEDFNEVADLIEKYPGYRDLNEQMLELFADHDDGRLDVDDLASFYQGYLSGKHDVPVSIADAHILLDELLHDRFDSFQEEVRAEDEAYAMNEMVDRVYRDKNRRTTDESRPTHRRRNRNLVRAVERLTDD